MANVYVRSGAAGAGTGADWTNAYTTLAAALTAKAAGDIFWVSEDHAETQASAMTLLSPGTVANQCFIYCVDHAGTVPPVSADLRTTATISTTGNNAQTITGVAYYYGIIFNGGTSGTGGTFIASTAGNSIKFENCSIRKGSTSAALITIGPTTGSALVLLKNTTFQFAAATSNISIRSCMLKWSATASAILGTVPTTLFAPSTGGGGATVTLDGVDLSVLGSGNTIVGAGNASQNYVLKDCKLGASVVVATPPTNPAGADTYLARCDSAGTNYRTEKYTYEGSQVTETVVIRTGGAAIGTVGLSTKIVTTANSNWTSPYRALLDSAWNAVTASNVGVTIEGVWNSASLPNNDQIWFDVGYLGASGNPLASFANGSKADNLASGSALTASTQAWDSLVTARANSTAYSLGDIRKVASNSGRIFFCTTAGTSAGSEPAGYATAVDGGSVTDNTAVFRAATRFKQTVTLSSPQPAQVGSLYVYVKAALATSTFYIDPAIALS